jgi:hypothetical protein
VPARKFGTAVALAAVQAAATLVVFFLLGDARRSERFEFTLNSASAALACYAVFRRSRQAEGRTEPTVSPAAPTGEG